MCEKISKQCVIAREKMYSSQSSGKIITITGHQGREDGPQPWSCWVQNNFTRMYTLLKIHYVMPDFWTVAPPG